jgi:hypothetical protein
LFIEDVGLDNNMGKAYRAPFYGITLGICKFNMTKMIEKRKARIGNRWHILSCLNQHGFIKEL